MQKLIEVCIFRKKNKEKSNKQSRETELRKTRDKADTDVHGNV